MEVRRRLSAPGLCRRPLRFTYVTLPFTGSPALARVLPSATMSWVRVPLQGCSLVAVAELNDVLSRTVAWLPAGIVAAPALKTEAASINPSPNDLRNFISPSSRYFRECELLLRSFTILNLRAFCYTLSAENGGTK